MYPAAARMADDLTTHGQQQHHIPTVHNKLPQPLHGLSESPESQNRTTNIEDDLAGDR